MSRIVGEWVGGSHSHVAFKVGAELQGTSKAHMPHWSLSSHDIMKSMESKLKYALTGLYVFN